MTSPPNPARRAWFIALLAGMASFIDAAALVGSGVVISVLYAEEFGLTPGLIGAVLAGQQFAFAVGAFTGGRLGDRFGRSRVLSSALAVFVAGALMMAFATELWMLFPAAILMGLGIGADLPVSLALANESTPTKKGRMVGLSSVLWALGIAAVQGLLSVVGHMGVQGGRIVFFALAATAVLILLLRVGLPESEEWLAARREQTITGRAVAARPRVSHLLLTRPVLAVVLATGLFYALWNVGASILGKYQSFMWVQLAGGDVETISRIALLATPVLFVAHVAFMFTVESRWRQALNVFGSTLIMVGWGTLAFGGATEVTITLLVFAFGLGSSFAGEAIYKVWAQELIPTLLRGTTQGITTGFTRIVAAVLALVIPTLVVRDPDKVLIAVFMCSVVSGLIGIFWIPRLRRPEVAGFGEARSAEHQSAGVAGPPRPNS